MKNYRHRQLFGKSPKQILSATHHSYCRQCGCNINPSNPIGCKQGLCSQCYETIYYNDWLPSIHTVPNNYSAIVMTNKQYNGGYEE